MTRFAYQKDHLGHSEEDGNYDLLLVWSSSPSCWALGDQSMVTFPPSILVLEYFEKQTLEAS